MLDDGTVAAADVPGRARLKADARHDINGQVHKVGQVGVELDKVLTLDLGVAGGKLQPGMGLEHGLGLIELLTQEGFGLWLLGQHAPGGYLADVSWGHVNAYGEAVLELGQFHPLVVNGGHHLVQFLLGGDHHPHGGDGLVRRDTVFAFLAEMLDHGAQVLDLFGAAGHVLAHLVNDKDDSVSGPAPGGQLKGAVHQGADGDVRLFLERGGPRVRRGVDSGGDGVEHGAGALDALRSLAHPLPHGIVLRRHIRQGRRHCLCRSKCAQLIAEHPGARLHERGQTALCLQLDLQLGHVVILGIVQLAEEHGVHDLGDRFGGAAHGPVHLHVEHDDVGVEALVDETDRVGDAAHQRIGRRLLLQLSDEELRRRVA